MIVEDCRNLTGRIAEKKQLRLQVDQLRRFQKVRSILSDQAQRIAPLLEVCRTLRAAGIEDVSLGEAARSFAKSLAGLRDSFLERPESIVEGQTVFSNAFRDGFNSCAESLESALSASWDRYTRERVPGTSLDVLNVLRPAFPAAVDRIRGLSGEIERERATLPRSVADIEAFNARVRSLITAWEELDGGRIPDAVLSFLRASASHQGAAIEFLTDEVKAWLSEHRILQSFSVRLATY